MTNLSTLPRGKRQAALAVARVRHRAVIEAADFNLQMLLRYWKAPGENAAETARRLKNTRTHLAKIEESAATLAALEAVRT